MDKHGLSCWWSDGRHYRHAAMHDNIHSALISAGVLRRHEPPGLLCSDGRRPDGVSVVPWRSRKFLVWDITSEDTYMYAPSYRNLAVQAAGAVAARTEIIERGFV